MRLRVALDHNFPIPIVRAMSDAVVEAELSPVSEIDSRFVRLDDAALVHALARRGWSAMVTCDANMLALPSVLARILQTRMTVVAALGQGHDPVASTGLVLAHLPHIVARHREDTPQVWRLRVGRRPHDDPWDLLSKLAERARTTARALYETHKLSQPDLSRDPLEVG